MIIDLHRKPLATDLHKLKYLSCTLIWTVRPTNDFVFFFVLKSTSTINRMITPLPLTVHKYLISQKLLGCRTFLEWASPQACTRHNEYFSQMVVRNSVYNIRNRTKFGHWNLATFACWLAVIKHRCQTLFGKTFRFLHKTSNMSMKIYQANIQSSTVDSETSG